MELLKNNTKIESNFNNISSKNQDKIKKNYIKSYGILCFNKINNELKCLLVKRKYTYAFFHFVMCNYVFTKKNIIKLLNNITIDEKRLIIEFDFDKLWNKLWFEKSSFNNIIYSKTKKLYQLNILNNKKQIISEINNSKNLKDAEANIWTIPKGRKNKVNENKLLVAIREFNEETSFVKNDYYLNFNFKKNYILDNKYKIIYYIAIYKNNMKINIDYTNINLLNEVNGINWFSLNEIKTECNYLYNNIKPAFTYVKHNDLIL
tara:strand:+ start:1608 stop:2393 length:786 start_codon:yes stop_codon:yes gene_type:complete